jgi:hypothetical protein
LASSDVGARERFVRILVDAEQKLSPQRRSE